MKSDRSPTRTLLAPTRLTALLAVAALALAAAGPALSQGNPTATLTGRVENDGQPLPGVTVTAKSPALQGSRTVFTTSSGDYLFPPLPPGDYTVTFELSGFAPDTRPVKLSAAQRSKIDVTLALTAVAAQAEVVAEQSTISQATQVATTYTASLIESLPVARTIVGAVTLAPGVNDGGPNATQTTNGGLSISGSQSFENLFLVNGVVVNENLRGQPLDLFIEDAVQETTTSTASISAEYGRFQGGVVNVITKSGGNVFSGSFRTSFTNDAWQAKTSFNENRIQDVVPTFEATLGGFLLKDRAWFFGAGRAFERDRGLTTSVLNTPFVQTDDEKRYEGKLTLTPFENQTLLGSYTKIDSKRKNDIFSGAMDLASLSDREDPQDLLSLNYTGTLAKNFFVEAQYSQRNWDVAKGNGAQTTDLIGGTILRDRSRAGTPRYHSPTFCGVCDPTTRDNRNFLAKGSLFLSTKSLGSHNVVFGYDDFADKTFSNNHQSGSDYRILGTSAIFRGTDIYPRILAGSTRIQWWPIYESSKGAEFRTVSAYVNDSWQVTSRLSVSLGLRWDKNDGQNASGLSVADDSAFSPRLAATFDLFGDDRLKLNASYGRYVAAITSGVGDSTAAGGNPSFWEWTYQGPALNADANAPAGQLLSQDEVIRRVFDWFFANGGTGRAPRAVDISGVTTVIQGSLKSPSTDEVSVGATLRLGGWGILRADAVRREAKNLYASRVDLSTGTVVVPQTGDVFDRGVIENTDELTREYTGLQTQFAVKPTRNLNVGGNWTWSHAIGNFDGETRDSGPVAGGARYYPEFRDPAWNRPRGDLGVDQRHKVRLWANYQVPIPTRFGTLGVSALERIDSGRAYDAFGTIDVLPYVTNPGYQVPDGDATYYFSGRGAFRTPWVTQTDVALNYGFGLKAFGKGVELFLQPEVLNLFNQQKVAFTDTRVFDTTVRTASNDATLQPFDPFRETPVEGVHYRKSATFGQAISGRAYQPPRFFRVSVGLRF